MDPSTRLHRNGKGLGRVYPTVAFWDESGKLRTQNLLRWCRDVPEGPVD